MMLFIAKNLWLMIADTMKVNFCIVNGWQGDGFLSMGAQMDAIKLALAGTQDW